MTPDEAVALMLLSCLRAAAEHSIPTEISVVVAEGGAPAITLAIDGATVGTYSTLNRAADVLMGRMGRVLAARSRAEHAASLQAAADAALLDPDGLPASATAAAPTWGTLASAARDTVALRVIGEMNAEHRAITTNPKS